MGGEHTDAFVQVVVDRGLADRVVDGQLSDPGAVQEPTDS
jgi:hypothetical protein